MHDAPVRQHGRLEAEERRRQHRGARAAQPARVREDEGAERQRRGDHRHPRPEEERVQLRLIALPEGPAVVQFAAQRALRRAGARRLVRAERQERQRRPELGEGRVGAVEAEVAVDEVGIARRDMHDLVGGDARARGLGEQVDRHRQQQAGAQQRGQVAAERPPDGRRERPEAARGAPAQRRDTLDGRHRSDHRAGTFRMLVVLPAQCTRRGGRPQRPGAGVSVVGITPTQTYRILPTTVSLAPRLPFI